MMNRAWICQDLSDSIAEVIARGRDRAISSGRSVLASVAKPLGGDLRPFEAFASALPFRVLWSHPEREFWMVGAGSAAKITGDGKSSMAEIPERFRSLVESAVIEGPNLRGVGLVAFGGFRYDAQAARDTLWRGFPDALLVVPRFLLTWSGGERWLTINVIVDPCGETSPPLEELITELEGLSQSKPDRTEQPVVSRVEQSPAEDWVKDVQEAMAAIDSGLLSKVVLARRKTLHANGRFSLERAVERLRLNYPGCFVFAFDAGATSFFGATPESLARVDDDRLSLTCLAGSAQVGNSLEEEHRLRRELVESGKERFEHAAVVSAVTSALKDWCDGLKWDAAPGVLKLKNVQHLVTQVTGMLCPGNGILDVVKRLHPTPAVAGVPTAQALELIRRIEGDRGWYAGPVGWVDRAGGGEFAVAIRSGLLHGNQATLFAGCGIVEGSVPERELREIEAKFQPVLEALGRS